MFLAIIPIIWIAGVAGRRLCRLVLGDSSQSTAPLELTAFGAATGLGILAYGVMVLGIAAQLRIGPIVAWIALLAVLGWREHKRAASDMLSWAKQIRVSRFGLGFLIGFAFFGAIALIGCFTPPTPMEWDSLSYHLADPKIYIRHGRLLYLPWESHSNFAFTMEMLYSIGLLLRSIALAKAFHFAMGILAALATYLIGARHMNARIGIAAALLFVSLPLVFWEAGTAYVDLAAVAYGALALLALLNGLRPNQSRWLWVCAMMLGWMLSVKATSAITLVLVCAWIVIALRRAPGGVSGAVRKAALVGLLAVAIGCPWYVKAAIYTHNPVYPFAFSVLGGKYWNETNAVGYSAAQSQFGVGHLEPADQRMPRPAEFMLVPWNLIMYSMPGHSPPAGSKPNPFNDFPSPELSLTPFLLAAIFVPAYLGGRLDPVAKKIGVFSLVSLAIWFLLTQQIRYLLPVIAPMCLFSVACMDPLLRERKASGYTLAIVFAASLVGSTAIGIARLQATVPVATGRVPEGRYLSSAFDAYGAMQYLNNQPPDSRVVFYGEPRDFYCDQPYMWGDAGQDPAFPPYEELRSTQALYGYFKSNHIRYIVINSQNFQRSANSGWAGEVNSVVRLPAVAPVYVSEDNYITVYEIK